LPGIGFIAISDFPLNQRHRAFKAGHPVFELSDIIRKLINTTVDMAQVFEHPIFHAVSNLPLLLAVL